MLGNSAYATSAVETAGNNNPDCPYGQFKYWIETHQYQCKPAPTTAPDCPSDQILMKTGSYKNLCFCTAHNGQFVFGPHSPACPKSTKVR